MSSHYHLFLNLHLSSLYASSTFPWSPSSTASLWSPPKQTIRPTSSSGWETMFGWRMKVFNRCSQYDYQHQFCDKLHCWIFLKTDNYWSLKFSPINICMIWPGALRQCWRGGGQELYLHPIQQGPTLPCMSVIIAINTITIIIVIIVATLLIFVCPQVGKGRGASVSVRVTVAPTFVRLVGPNLPSSNSYPG